MKASGSICSLVGQHGPMECFHMTKKSKGAMTECKARSTLTGRNSPWSMPRCSTDRTMASAGLMTSSRKNFGDARGFGRAVAPPPLQHHPFQQLAGFALKLGQFGSPLVHRVHHVFTHHSLEQVFLVRKVQKQSALGDASAQRHFFDAGGGEAFFHEQIQRRFQEFSWAVLFAAFAFVGKGEKPLLVNAGKNRGPVELR
eukprot:gene22195-28308_t